MKLSEYAKQQGVVYRTAWNRFHAGRIPGAFMNEFGHVVVPTRSEINRQNAAIYTRVSSSQNRANLDSQVDRLKEYAIAKGYTIVHIIKEVGSGINDNRPQLIKLLQKDDWGTLVVEHKDRLTRFGFNYIKTLLEFCGKQIDVANLAQDDKTDLMNDLVSILYSFSARMYGLRRSKKNTHKIVSYLKQIKDEDIGNAQG